MGVTAMLGSTLPGKKLVLEAVGGLFLTLEEMSWPLPRAVAPTGVRLTTAASPGLPFTLKHSSPDGAIDACAGVDTPMSTADATTPAAMPRALSRRVVGADVEVAMARSSTTPSRTGTELSLNRGRDIPTRCVRSTLWHHLTGTEPPAWSPEAGWRDPPPCGRVAATVAASVASRSPSTVQAVSEPAPQR